MEEAENEILETFWKVEVNIPLLDAIKQIPRYAKFLKELCTHKRKLKGNERISMGRNVSALIVLLFVTLLKEHILICLVWLCLQTNSGIQLVYKCSCSAVETYD